MEKQIVTPKPQFFLINLVTVPLEKGKQNKSTPSLDEILGYVLVNEFVGRK